jgi:hypothetical protein
VGGRGEGAGFEEWEPSSPDGKAWDAHLRSTHDATGHHIQAAEGEIGHVEDFILDGQSWAIRYLDLRRELTHE